MKFIQVVYGYILLISVVFLSSKAILIVLSLELDEAELFIICLLTTIFFRIRPHPTESKYPLAFEIQLLFRR